MGRPRVRFAPGTEKVSAVSYRQACMRSSIRIASKFFSNKQKFGSRYPPGQKSRHGTSDVGGRSDSVTKPSRRGRP